MDKQIILIKVLSVALGVFLGSGVYDYIARRKKAKMAKYINADELKSALLSYGSNNDLTGEMKFGIRCAIEFLDETPAADVVESKDIKEMFDFHKKMLDEGGYAKITRCKDCKYAEYDISCNEYECMATGCGLFYNGNFYCADAERKEAENGTSNDSNM